MNMSESFRNYKYKSATKPDGSRTLNNGDIIADELLPLEPEDVCYAADLIFKEPKGYHVNKYEHLNRGQQRMNAGNRIRAAYIKGDDGEKNQIIFIIQSVVFLIAKES